MRDTVERATGGQFMPGQSGNPAGARRRKRKLDTPADFHELILRVANEEIELPQQGRMRRMTRFEYNAISLATGQANRLAARDFMTAAKVAAMELEIIRRNEARKAAQAGPTL